MSTPIPDPPPAVPSSGARYLSRWTAAEDATLREEFARGPGYADRAAVRLGRNAHGCVTRAWKIGLRTAGDGRKEMAK